MRHFVSIQLLVPSWDRKLASYETMYKQFCIKLTTVPSWDRKLSFYETPVSLCIDNECSCRLPNRSYGIRQLLPTDDDVHLWQRDVPLCVILATLHIPKTLCWEALYPCLVAPSRIAYVKVYSYKIRYIQEWCEIFGAFKGNRKIS